MKFTDIFIGRPVLASVISLLILMIGLRSLGLLEVRQYPETRNTVVKVTTEYPGADSGLVKGFVTTPLQQAVAEANGIDYLFSRSSQGRSVIEAHMKLNYEANDALSEIQAKVASKRNVLPSEAEDPVIDSTTGDTTALMYVALFSETMPRPQITDYILRVVKPKLQALPGVAKAQLFGQEFAMRIWLDPLRMASLDITADEVNQVLRDNNYLSGAGSIRGESVTIDLSADTDVSNPRQFRELVIRKSPTNLVRLEDVAEIELGSENYDSSAWYKGIPGVFIGIEQAPGANPLTVAETVSGEIPKIRAQLPAGLQVQIPYDASNFIRDSIDEVFNTLIEAVLIVLLVIYLTLGSIRAALIPAVAVPLSLIGTAFIMLMLGYSLNLLTLLSMVLAIGLVVDDAIIVVENVHRHIEMGKSKLDAALLGARELALPIIAMTTTLVAVFAPIGFMEGLVGTLFTEFAFTLAAAVLVSGVVALTLSPMLSSRVLADKGNEGRFEKWIEQLFSTFAERYRRILSKSLDSVSVTVTFALVLLLSIYFMFVTSPKELAPVEDQGILFFQAVAPRTATLDYQARYAKQIQHHFEQFENEYNDSFYLLGGMAPNEVFGGFKMVSVRQRDRSQDEVMPELQGAMHQVAGFQTAVFPRPSLPGPGGFPIQFVLTSDRSYDELIQAADQLVGTAMGSGRFMFLKKSIELDRPVTNIEIDRNRAGDLGITMADIGRNLAALMGEGYVNRFSMEERSYKVIPQVSQRFRLNEAMLEDYYLRAESGNLVPMSSIVRLSPTVEPSSRTQFQQLNSVTLEGVMKPGVTQGDALDFLLQQSKALLPPGYNIDYKGESRQYSQQGSALVVTFFMSLLVIYLVLAAQFESWRDPLIILVAVPMSVAGAMFFITLGFSSINIYTQVGLITLIGVVAKNGILIVEFANQLRQQEGLNKREAVEKASAIRLRPIIMTSVSLMVAMVPLLAASGPGAVSRFDIGLVIVSGLGIGTFFTLFVLPAFYMLIAPDEQSREAVHSLKD